MSEDRNRSGRDFSRYDGMETEELEQLLRSDADAPEGTEPDVELLLYVMEVLADRRRNNNSFTGKTAREAFESFKQNYLPEEVTFYSAPEEKKSDRKPLYWLRSLAAVAAVLVFVVLGSVTANAFGFDLWRAVAVWAQETFRLESGVKAESELPEVDRNREYRSLEEALYDMEDAQGIVPTWIPEGYELTEIIIDETPLQKCYVAVYQYDNMKMKISVRSYQNGYPEQIEQNDGTEETYISGENIYYFFEDIDSLQTVWINGSYECYISGELTVEQMQIMIDSILKG